MVGIRYLCWTVVLLLVIGCGHKAKEEVRIIEEKEEVVVEPKIEKKDMDADIQRAKEHISSGRYEEAIVLLRQLAEIDPENAALYYLLGQAYEEEGWDKLSVHAFIKALQLDPDIAGKVEEDGA